MVAVCEALLYAHRAGLDPETVLASVSTGAAGSWSLANLAPRIVAGDFAPGFYVDHFVKDMSIALEEARRMRLALPGLALAHQLYVALQAQGRGRDGTQSLVHALAGLSSVEWPDDQGLSVGAAVTLRARCGRRGRRGSAGSGPTPSGGRRRWPAAGRCGAGRGSCRPRRG